MGRAFTPHAPSEHDRHNAPCPGCAQGAGRLRCGRASRHHVIDQQHGFTGHDGFRGGERAAHVLTPARERLRRLNRRRTDAVQPGGPYRQAQPRGQTVGQRLALVVAAPPAPPPVQRHRHERVGSEGAQGRAGVVGPKLAQQFGQSLSRMVFHAQHRLAQQAVVGAEAHGGGKGERFVAAVQAPAVGHGERADRGGAAGTGGGRIGEKGGATGMAERPGVGQRPSAELAQRRVEQVQQTTAQVTTGFRAAGEPGGRHGRQCATGGRGLQADSGARRG